MLPPKLQSCGADASQYSECPQPWHRSVALFISRPQRTDNLCEKLIKQMCSRLGVDLAHRGGTVAAVQLGREAFKLAVEDGEKGGESKSTFPSRLGLKESTARSLC